AEPVAPPAPVGFGDEYSAPEPDPEYIPAAQPVEEVVEVEDAPEETNMPTSASLKRLKKAELVELATLQGLDSSGTKADIISRLIR
ncbi:MAG: SAP domain-containing protein, partial [Candidatus Thalassarchaeaceae archaeon]|nr:SAP domain-containing protein [Candidatus Thalassarchaeaceae archaeon]